MDDLKPKVFFSFSFLSFVPLIHAVFFFFFFSLKFFNRDGEEEDEDVLLERASEVGQPQYAPNHPITTPTNNFTSILTQSFKH